MLKAEQSNDDQAIEAAIAQLCRAGFEPLRRGRRRLPNIAEQPIAKARAAWASKRSKISIFSCTSPWVHLTPKKGGAPPLL
ncbi:hypothetical protein [Bradyrhizobium sp. DASA03120]|uniref:hypothetical protein n=1 Tax=Bradyrhizobium sp. SMVTL-02 TaxID=3395917 RepID=UPI003F70FED2